MFTSSKLHPPKDYITVKESRCLDARLADRLAKVPKSTGEVFSAIHQNFSGQIIGTSHNFTPNGGLVREIPFISGKPRLVKNFNLARFFQPKEMTMES